MSKDEVLDNLDLEEIVKQFQRCFDTDAGQIVLAYLKERYIDLPCLSDSQFKTMYFLGQKELAQTILGFVEEKNVKLPTVVTEDNDNE